MELGDIVNNIIRGRAGEGEQQAVRQILSDRSSEFVARGKEYIKHSMFQSKED